jgi:4,4'-diaponeurosporenoate glycosyltransferase
VHVVDLMVALVFWSLGFVFLFRISLCCRRIGSRGPRPSVCVIIPAKNEENSLPVLLASLQRQDLVGTEIIVVVDESDDRTREVAEARGVKTILAGPRPEGWFGKPWACYQGALTAKGDILLFLDADTQLEENGLRRIVDTCIERGGVVSIQPYHRTKRLYEELSAFFNIVGMAGMGAFTLFGGRIKPVGLFGPCVAIRKDTYFEIGGHAAVKGQIVEDLALGEKLKEKKQEVHCFGGKGTISFRMYPNGLRDLIDGWSKGFATGAAKTYLPIIIAIVLWIGGGLSVARFTIETIAGAKAVPAIAWGAAYLAYCAQMYWMLFRIGNFRVYTALLYPISLLFSILVFVYSAFAIFVRRSVRWKGATLNLKDKGPAT